MNIDYYAASNVQVTIKVPKGVVLEDRVINANGGSAFLGGVYANSIRWTPNDSNDNSKGGTLTYNVPADKRMVAAEKLLVHQVLYLLLRITLLDQLTSKLQQQVDLEILTRKEINYIHIQLMV